MQKVECDSTFAKISLRSVGLFLLRDAVTPYVNGVPPGTFKRYVIVHLTHRQPNLIPRVLSITRERSLGTRLTNWKPHNGGEMESRYLKTSCCPVECNIMAWGVLMTSMDDVNSRLYLKRVASNHLGPSMQCIGKGCKLLEYVDN